VQLVASAHLQRSAPFAFEFRDKTAVQTRDTCLDSFVGSQRGGVVREVQIALSGPYILEMRFLKLIAGKSLLGLHDVVTRHNLR
jgi:hypothetical protein